MKDERNPQTGVGEFSQRRGPAFFRRAGLVVRAPARELRYGGDSACQRAQSGTCQGHARCRCAAEQGRRAQHRVPAARLRYGAHGQHRRNGPHVGGRPSGGGRAGLSRHAFGVGHERAAPYAGVPASASAARGVGGFGKVGAARGGGLAVDEERRNGFRRRALVCRSLFEGLRQTDRFDQELHDLDPEFAGPAYRAAQTQRLPCGDAGADLAAGDDRYRVDALLLRFGLSGASGAGDE